MTRINLLPWREQVRQEEKKKFLSILVMIVILSLFASFKWVGHKKGQIESQNERNAMLQKQITLLQKDVKEIAGLKEQRQDLCDRLEVIQNLQGTRPFIVHYFDEMARVVPDSLYLTEIERKNELLALKGITESNNRVSELMRNLDNSEWYQNPNLQTVIADADFGEQASRFAMTISTYSPSQDEESADNNSCFKEPKAKKTVEK